jgi:CRP-like cAMP-binding protein
VIQASHERLANTEAAAFEQQIMGGLRQVDFLRTLRDEELRLLVPGVIVQKFGVGELIVREGDEGDSLFIIRAGTVEVVAAKNGREVHITDLMAPAFFGEMALMTGEKRSATIRARTDIELLELNRDAFGELFKNHPETAAQMGQVMALRISERSEMLNAASSSDGAHNRASWLINRIRAAFNMSAATH